jgi:hypothetical protein
VAFERRPPRPNTAKAGLGYHHQQERKRLLPHAYGKPCPYYGVDPRCPGLMERGQALDLDHGRPRALGGRTGDGTGRIAHHGCNLRAGARLGGRLSHARSRRRMQVEQQAQPAQPTPRARQSRAW